MRKTVFASIILLSGCGISTKEKKPETIDRIVTKIVEKACPAKEPCPVCPAQKTRIIEKKIPVVKDCEHQFFTISDGQNNYRIEGCKHKIDMITNSNQLVDMIKILAIDP